MGARSDALRAKRAIGILLQLAGKQKGRAPGCRLTSFNTFFGLATRADIRRLGPQFNWTKQSVQTANPAHQTTIATESSLLEENRR